MITIRAAQVSDIDAISQLVSTPEELFLVFPSGHYPLDERQVRNLFQTRMELTVVCDETNIIGFANLYGYSYGENIYIGNVILLPAYRSQGLGKRLMLYMLKCCFEKYHVNEARVSVFGDNANAKALYAKLGFVAYAKETRVDPSGDSRRLIHLKLKKSQYQQFDSPSP